MSDWWSADPVASGGDAAPVRLTVTPQRSALDARARDLAIRTIYGEAANEPDDGQAAVAAVIRNRIQAGRYGGDNVESVVRARNQFEPWNTPQGQFRMMSLRPEDPRYERIGAIVDRVFSGEAPDPTNGATHFFSPTAQAALGRNVPAWAQGEGQPIGRHTFYAPEGRVGAPQASSDQWWTADPVANQQPTAQVAAPASVAERFAPAQNIPVENQPALQTGLNAAANRMRSAPVTTSPGQQLAIDYANQGSAAAQGTSPIVAAQAPNLISSEVHQSDAGELLYRDRNGQLVPTDQNKHVILRDPADNTLKVYARTAGTDEGRLSAAGRLLSTGAAAGAPTARPAVPVPSQTIVPKASDIAATSKPYYKAFTREASSIEVPAETAVGIAERLRGALDRINLTEEMAGAPARNAIALLENGKVTTVADLQKVKRMAGRGFANSEKDVRDGAGAISAEIRKVLSEVAPEAAQNFKTADAIHSTATTMQDLQRKGAVADLRAGRAGYGGNAVNTMRQVLSPIVEAAEKGKATGFQPGEIAAIRDIVVGTPATNALRLVGQVSPTSGLGLIRATGAGGTAMFAGASGGTALAIPAIGAASNKLATILTGKQIDRLKDLVAKRSPAYAEAVERAVKRYEQAQAELASNPSPGRLGAYVSASRALASGLTRDGIKITSGDLLRSIQGPVKSAAEDEQP